MPLGSSEHGQCKNPSSPSQCQRQNPQPYLMAPERLHRTGCPALIRHQRLDTLPVCPVRNPVPLTGKSDTDALRKWAQGCTEAEWESSARWTTTKSLQSQLQSSPASQHLSPATRAIVTCHVQERLCPPSARAAHRDAFIGALVSQRDLLNIPRHSGRFPADGEKEILSVTAETT